MRFSSIKVEFPANGSSVMAKKCSRPEGNIHALWGREPEGEAHVAPFEVSEEDNGNSMPGGIRS